jgi:hypothetical protein
MNARLLTSFHIKVGSLPAKAGRDSLRRRLLCSVLKRLMVVTLYLPGMFLLHGATLRYSTSTDTIHAVGGGVATLTDIATVLRHAPLSLVGTVTNTIRSRNFLAESATKSAQITVVSRDANGSNHKVWIVKGSSSSTKINYQVGDPQPGTTYFVTRSSVLISTATTEAPGYISLASAPGSTCQVTYTIYPI